MNDMIENFKHSLYEGFIDRKSLEVGTYKPKLLLNNPAKNESVLQTLTEQLENSESFLFSVAFITESGLATLKSTLLDLKAKGIKGRILTSTFLQFNKPKVFQELLKLTNVEVRVANVEGFHSKGYIFSHRRHYSLIVGSSNLTASALKQNHEWNVKLNSLEDGDIIYHFLDQFEQMWLAANPLTETWINSYAKTYVAPFIQGQKIADITTKYDLNQVKDALEIKPNKMQEAALQSLENIRHSGADRSLIISATGTGKTYLSAFDVRRFRPKKMLFIAHREQILKQAKNDYHKLLGGSSDDFGMLSGQSKERDQDYLFATIQTLSKEENLTSFNPEHFDYILIDEVHKAGAKSYRKVIDYFKPKFLLGMTATPERTDDFNIYNIFDYNIAYEIRLQEALEEDMLCPFHYFGVADFQLNGEVITDTTLLNKLVTEERINHLIDKINYYGYSGNSVKGLMFCSRKEEAHLLSDALNKRGYRTVALTGEDSQEERALQIDRLEKGSLDYILTVDIFNEGIDIPSINQIVMLRQTESSIIFVQQLGRGLRKHKDKDFVTVIDFIGNYKNNYLIPVALSGDQSQNKDSIRRHTKDTTYIKGVSTVNFEEVARKRIFDSINRTNLTTLTILRDAFIKLQNKIGRLPYLYDFIEHNSIDPQVIVEKYSNYYLFLQKVQCEVNVLTEYEIAVLTMLSLEVLNGKRKHEHLLLSLLLEHGAIEHSRYINYLKESNCLIDESTIKSVQSVLDLSFFTKNNVKKYGNKAIVYLDNDKTYRFNDEIYQSLQENEDFKDYIKDILACAKEKNKNYQCSQALTLYKKYTRKEVCKYLNWDKDESATLFGYKTKHGTCPIFITYHKDESIEESVKYEDELISSDLLKWFTRSNRTIKSKEVQTIVNADENNIDLHLFMKKNNDEGTDFYYLGKAFPNKDSVEQQMMFNDKGKELPVVEMNLTLNTPVENHLYRYLIAE